MRERQQGREANEGRGRTGKVRIVSETERACE